MIAAHPGASLRAIAKEAGVSLAPRGMSAVGSSRAWIQHRQASGRGQMPFHRPQDPREHRAIRDSDPTASAPVQAPPVELPSLLDGLRRDPTLR